MQQGHDHVQPLAAGGLAKTFHADFGEVLPHILGGLDDIGEFDLWCGIEIEHQPAGNVGRVRRTIPGMQLEPADLRHGRQTFDAVDLQIGLAIARYFYQFQQVRGAGHRVALEELFAADAVGGAYHGTWPSLDVPDHPAADRLEITGEVELGHALAVAGVGPELLVGLRDDDAHHLGGPVRRGLRGRPARFGGGRL